MAACGGGEAPESAAPPAVRSDAHVFAGAVAPPAAELVNPFAGDSQSAAQGARIYVDMNCDGCHGGGGVGFVGPSFTDGRWRYGGSDGVVYHSIFYGRPRGMPAYGGILSPTAIWKVVTYLESLPIAGNVATEAW